MSRRAGNKRSVLCGGINRHLLSSDHGRSGVESAGSGSGILNSKILDPGPAADPGPG